jgi:hypothetical protein
MFVRSRLAPAIAAAAFSAIVSFSASAASINDLRAMGYGLMPVDAPTIDVGADGIVLKADAATRDEVLRLARELVRQGRNGGPWDGEGFVSSEAAHNPLARLVAALNGHGGLPTLDTFGGEAIDANTVIIACTWHGDIDLDGRVTADDYFRIDSDFFAAKPSQGGDLTGDGKVNADDYFLIDASFLGQGAAKTPRAPKSFSLTSDDGGTGGVATPAVPLPSAAWAGLGLLAGVATWRHRRHRTALGR